MTAADPRKSERVMTAVLQMKKLDIAELERAVAEQTSLTTALRA